MVCLGSDRMERRSLTDTLVGKAIRSEEAQARIFLHVALDGLEATDSLRGHWTMGYGVCQGGGL
jgi:hypothetical protein